MLKAADISKMFQNEKIGEIFSNCEGGMGNVFLEIDKVLTFEDLASIQEFAASPVILKFIDENESIYPFAVSFILKLIDRTSYFQDKYDFTKTKNNILLIAAENYEKILRQYPASSSEASLKLFGKKHQEVRISVYQKTFYETKNFFDSPFEYIESLG